MTTTDPRRLSAGIEQLLADVFGADEIRKLIGGEDEEAIDLLANEEIGKILGREQTRIAIVGTSNVGKSSLVNELFRDEVVLEGARVDVTNQVTRVALPSGMVLYDTPGLGGLDEENEEITRAFLGLPAYRKTPETVSMCLLDSGAPCPNRRETKESGTKEVTHPSPAECTDKYQCERVRPLQVGSPELAAEQPDIVLHIFSLRAGVRRDDRDAFELLRSNLRCPVIPVGNQIDSLPTAEEQAQAIAGARKVAEDIVCVDSKTHRDIKPLVERVVQSLPTAKVHLFNRELKNRYQATRDEVFRRYVAQIAAKAAIADTTQKIERFVPSPKDPNKKVKVKLTAVDQLAEVLSLRIFIDYMFDEETWRTGRSATRIGEMIASNRDQFMSALGGGLTASGIIVGLSIASGMAGNLGFYAVAATILGWFGIGGPAYMAFIAAVGGPLVVIPVVAVVLGAAVFGLLRWIRPGWVWDRYGDFSAVKQIYRQAFLLRRQLLEANAGVLDAIKDDPKRLESHMKALGKTIDKEVGEKLKSVKKAVVTRVSQFKKSADDPETRAFVEKALADALSAVKPDPMPQI